MNTIKMIKSASYLPKRKVINSEIEKKLNLESGYIYQRTGIQERYYAETEETIENMAIEAVRKIGKKYVIKDVGLIVVATTSTAKLMPGIANTIQKELKINPCICLDILAGCGRLHQCL